jgi:hypothetical protein
MPGKEIKHSTFKTGYNISNYFLLGTLYDSGVLTASPTITTILFVLRVASAEFQTSRPEVSR